MNSDNKTTLLALQKKAKTFKMIAIVYASILIMMFIVAFLTTQRNGISFLTFLPLFFLPMEIVNIYQYKKIKKQITELSNANE